MLIDGVLIGVLTVRVEPVLGFGQTILDGGLVVLAELVGKLILILNSVAHRVDVVLECVLGIDALLDGLILVGKLLGVADHLLDLLLGQTALIVGDRDGLGLADTLLNTGDGEDTVFVDLESDLNLWHTSSGGRDSGQIELAELMVVLTKGTLTLEDGNGDGGLLVLVSGESLGLLGGDDSTTLDNGSHDTTDGLNTESKWGNIDEKNILGLFSGLATENTTLNSGAISDSLVWVNTSVWFLTVEEVLNELLNLGDTGGATNENDLVNLASLQLRVIHDGLDGFERVFEEVVAKFLELGTSQGLLEVDAVDEGLDGNLNLLDSGQVSLGLLDLRLQLLKGARIRLDVDAVLLLERLDEVISDTLVKIFTTEMSVTSGCEHLEDTVIDSQDRDIEGTTTKIENDDVLLVLLVKTVGNSGGGRLVDDTEDLESSDDTSVLGGLSLGVIEVGWDGDDGVLDVLTEVLLSDLLHLGEDHGRDFLWAELLSASTWHIN